MSIIASISSELAMYVGREEPYLLHGKFAIAGTYVLAAPSDRLHFALEREIVRFVARTENLCMEQRCSHGERMEPHPPDISPNPPPR